MPFFDLPQDWSAEQPIAVSDFLEQLRDTILVQYHEQIREYFEDSGRPRGWWSAPDSLA